MGSRTVKTHDWRTEWLIPAPLPTVYEAVTSRSAVRRWWPSMELMDEAGGVLPTPFVKAWLGRTQEARREAEQLRDEVLSAIRGRTTHEVLPFSGQTAGLIHDLLPATVIVE